MYIEYDMPLYRPPSEGNNIIIQATLGCSFNNCTFCSMYKTKNYKVRLLTDIENDIRISASNSPNAHRIFLADGDAYVLETEFLLEILRLLAKYFKNLNRVSAYATPFNINKKSLDEMKLLRENKLNLLYLGIESGSNKILKLIKKGASQKSHIKAILKAREANVKISATVILGLGGKSLWREHILGTAELVNEAAPNYLSTLQLMLDDITHEEFSESHNEDFELQDDKGILDEQRLFIDTLEPSKPVIFRSNHASNCLALAGNLPKDKGKIISQIDRVMHNCELIRPEFYRSL